MTSTPERAFSLAEVLIALAILGIGMLGLISVCSVGLQANKKSLTMLTAEQVADRQINRNITKAVVNDEPPGARDRFWRADYPYPTTPWVTGVEKVGTTEYKYALYATTVDAVAGGELGSGVEDNRLKKVDIVVTWWGEQRQGYGTLRVNGYRLINEQDNL